MRQQRKQAVTFPLLPSLSHISPHPPPSSPSPYLPSLSLFSSFSPSSTSLSLPFNRSLAPLLVSFLSFRYLSSLTSYLTLFPASSTSLILPPCILSTAFHLIFSSSPFVFVLFWLFSSSLLVFLFLFSLSCPFSLSFTPLLLLFFLRCPLDFTSCPSLYFPCSAFKLLFVHLNFLSFSSLLFTTTPDSEYMELTGES